MDTPNLILKQGRAVEAHIYMRSRGMNHHIIESHLYALDGVVTPLLKAIH